MRVALIHDHLAQDGGAERVLKVLAEMFPEAPIYTLLYEKKNADKYFKNRLIQTSVIQKLPGGIKHYQWYMPFMPMAVEFFDLRGYDLVISNTSAFAKGVITSLGTLHICYCHTPTRYLWDYTHQYIYELSYNKYLKKVISLVLNYIRMWDRLAADRVDVFFANSGTIQKRIKKYYRRESAILYPPVEVEKFYISQSRADSSPDDGYFLIGGRLAPYKRVDIVIEAFKKMDKNLKIFGDGVDLDRLKKIAGNSKNIEFLGRIDDKEKAELYSHCLAFLNPQEEDFGITVIEAMASGRPVIAFDLGGARETVSEGKTGLFFHEQTPEAIIEAIENFYNISWNSEEIRKWAEKFSVEEFKKNLNNLINFEYGKFEKDKA